ncbi:MAG: uncharacterized protein KVP18_004097 [Porospora cf. gigantea A]|nr:MAG: hypothetical protein KVP18_004097 [Porospora cf. gigantea A]
MRILGLLTLAASRELILKFDAAHADCREKSIQEYTDETVPLVSEDLGSPVTAEVLSALENIIIT